MKSKLNITIDEDILVQMKRHALQQNKSISEIVENYFRGVLALKPKSSFVELIDKLPQIRTSGSANLKEEYYQGKAKRYGF